MEADALIRLIKLQDDEEVVRLNQNITQLEEDLEQSDTDAEIAGTYAYGVFRLHSSPYLAEKMTASVSSQASNENVGWVLVVLSDRSDLSKHHREQQG